VRGEGTIDRLLAHPMGAVRVGEIARHEHQVRIHLAQEVGDDLHIRRPDRILAHLAGLIEREIQKPRRSGLETQREDTGHRLGLPDDPLEVLDLRNVHLARGCFAARKSSTRRSRSARDWPSTRPLGREPADEVGVAPDIVVEHGQVSAGHVGHGDGVPVLGQLGEDPAHRDHVVVGMGREADDPLPFG
jgi:hypothetical protein